MERGEMERGEASAHITRMKRRLARAWVVRQLTSNPMNMAGDVDERCTVHFIIKAADSGATFCDIRTPETYESHLRRVTHRSGEDPTFVLVAQTTPPIGVRVLPALAKTTSTQKKEKFAALPKKPHSNGQ